MQLEETLFSQKGVTASVKSFLKLTHALVILFTAASLFALSLSLAVPVSAKTTQAASYALSGYDGDEPDVFTPRESRDIRLLDMTAPWDLRGDVIYVKRHIQNGYSVFSAILEREECEGETTFTLEMSDDLSDFNMICFGVGFTSSAESPSPIRAELKLEDYGGNRVISRTYLQIPEDAFEDGGFCWNMLYFDISGFEGRNDSAELTVTLTYDPASSPNVFRITNPYAAVKDSGGFSYIEQYLTNSLKASAGVFGMKSGAARPDERGQVRLSGPLILPEQPETGADAFLEIRLSRFVSGGISVGVGYEFGDVAYSGHFSLSSDGESIETITIPIEMTGRLQSIELNFDSMICEGYFKLLSIQLHSSDTVPLTGNPDIGKVTDLTRSGSSIRFSGVMDRNAVREYGDTALRFYAVPGWSGDSTGEAVEIGQMKVSTRFDYTADLSAYPYLADSYRFFAGIADEDGDILPLSPPVYPEAADIPQKTLSNVGLHDAAAVGVFESNASHVIVDVPLDQLLTVTAEAGEASTSLSYTVCRTVTRRIGEEGTEQPSEGTASEGTEVNVIEMQLEQAAVNHTLLRTLDSEINFYISAGIEVYLRLSSETVIPGLTYEADQAEHYSFFLETPEARYFYTAIVRFLCRRYSGIAGIVTGYSVNDGVHTGDTGDETAAVYARELAELCRLTYNAASTEISDILIVLPFGDGSEKTGDSFRSVDPKSLNVMMSWHLEEMGTVPWVMMYCTEHLRNILGTDILCGDDLTAETKHSDSGSTAQRIRQFTDELDVDGCAAVMYYYEPEYETVMYGFSNTSGMTVYTEYLAEMFAKLCGSTRARAVFLSLNDLTDRLDYEFYSYLKKAESMSVSEGSSRRSVSDYPAVPAESADLSAQTASQTLIWDFSDKFHPLGWIAGGGVESCLTVYSDLFDEERGEGERYARVLRSVISLDETYSSPERAGIAAGIVLRNLTRTVDLSEVDYLEFTFALNHPGMIVGTGHEAGTVVLIVGSDDCRAEFAVETAAYGQIQKYVCDLRDYEFRDKVNYMGILVYGDHEIYLDLSSVGAYSNTLSLPELEAVFAAPEADAPVTDHGAIVLVSGIVCIGSVCAAVLLIRHDVEEHREYRRRLREKKHTKRERIRRN